MAFSLPHPCRLLPNELASLSLICSQFVLLIFTFVNLHLSDMPVFTLGAGCSVAVILANRSFMPLTVDVAARLVDQTVSNKAIGERISRARKGFLLPGATIFGFRACRSLYESVIRDILAAPCWTALHDANN
jgi:hypothetical protein